MGDMSEQQVSDTLVFYVNGKKVVEKHADPEWTLLYYLRNKLCLTGSKLGCAEGGCGACTVMVSRFNRTTKHIDHISVNACLAPVCSMHGLAVTTVEGIGSTKTKLHPVQERIASSHGSQCGFCTPGIVMSMYTLLRNNPLPSSTQMQSAFEGNLCRCTGYRPILDGFKTFTKDFQCQMGEKCCQNQQNGCQEDQQEESEGSSQFLPYDPTQEPIFPSELQLSEELDKSSLVFRGERVTWYRPTSLDELVDLKAKHPQARIIIGNTEIGVEMKFKNQLYPVLIAGTHVRDLGAVRHTDAGIEFGASVSLTQMDAVLKEAMQHKPEQQTRVYSAVVEMLRWFAGHQIRNVAAIAGNIMTASPISDLNPLFLAAGCKLKLLSKESRERVVVMDENFFVGYRKTIVKPSEVLVSILIPYTTQDEHFGGYKQAHRREDDIAIVNAGFKVRFQPNSEIISEVAMAFGGMAPFTIMPTKTMKQLVGRKWDGDLIPAACELLAKDLPLPPGTPGGMEPYRRTLTTSFFFKFFLSVQLQLQKQGVVPSSSVADSDLSAISLHETHAIQSLQLYEQVAETQEEHDAVGRPLQHASAAKQASGEAVYIDDMPAYKDECYLALVCSTESHARIREVDTSKALAMPGVLDYITHTDVPGTNWGGVGGDEEIFAEQTVTCQGHVIGAIVADSAAHAQLAAKAVTVRYDPLPPVITIEEAIAAESYYPSDMTLRNGDLEAGFSASDHIVEGEVRMGGQEHFYLETHATIAVPKGEDGEMEIFCSSQHPHNGQISAAKALGVPANRIAVRCKRMGGGFGGKETRFTALLLPVTIAAHKIGKPVRCMLDRDEDMVISGGRHPFLGRYKVGFTNEGKILALEVDLYSNAGNALDLSLAVMERAVFHFENCYKIPNLRVTGKVCKTNLPSNTAFRGFGGPQGMFVSETWISDVANKLNIPPEQVRDVNLYEEGDVCPYSQPLINCNLRRCWDQVISKSDFTNRRQQIEQFNRQNRWKKRGISLVPTKFGIAFTLDFFNQAGALVHIYTDGSVLLAHGGTEMGQGLHTKMIQVASKALGIPVSKIFISESSTVTVPNASPTAASASADLNGMAILNACQTLLQRLEPFMKDNPKGSWEDWVTAAYVARTGLSTTGYYGTPGIGYDWKTNSGNPFNYFTCGAACSEVEIDCLTGDHTVLRTDIVMDVGSSLNPAIDVGQIEGGFVQGYGLFTLEELRYSPSGFLYTRGPGFYKIPGFGDIPAEFNVSLLKGTSNPRAVYSSKAIGEPPLFLASSVFFAIKAAINSARREVGLDQLFQLDSPATAERIRMACEDQFTKQFPAGEAGTFKPWFVVA